MATRRPTLRAGDRGPDVLALQQTLARVMGASHSRNKQNGVYGSLTVLDVARFKRTHHLKPVDGKVWGDRAWDTVEKHLTKQAKALLARAVAEAANAARQGAEATAIRMFVAEMYWLLAHRWSYIYKQYRPMPASMRLAIARRRLDCSSTVTLAAKAAGWPDPNGMGYNGYGYTGTLARHGEWVSSPRAGDLAFYGGSRSVPAHVAAVVDDGSWVISFGHTPPTKYRLRYRGDYLGCKRYPVLK